MSVKGAAVKRLFFIGSQKLKISELQKLNSF